jgi:hypothetical protein
VEGSCQVFEVTTYLRQNNNMKHLLILALISLSLSATAQSKSKTAPLPKDTSVVVVDTTGHKDPVITLQLTLPQASAIIYSIRYSAVMNASEANQFADLLVKQVNAQMNKTTQPPPIKQK